MKTQEMKWWLGAALLALAGRASATLPAQTSAYLNIEVTINATLSVSVDGATSSTYTSTAWTGTPNEALASLSSKWALSTDATSLDVSGLGTIETWGNAASTATVIHDQYGAQAVFGSSTTASNGCPAAGASVWDSGTIAPPLTTSPQLYTNGGAFADTATASMSFAGSNPNPDNATYNQMYVGHKRALCWRLIMPSSTYTTHTQEVQVIVTAIPAS